jgi:hypothetical protein
VELVWLKLLFFHRLKSWVRDAFLCADHFPQLLFESWSRLLRLENCVFRETGLVEIILPSSVEVLAEGCFSFCPLLTSVFFESGSRLSRIETSAFKGTGLIEIILSASIEVLDEECFSWYA